MEWSISSCFLNPGEHLDAESVRRLGKLGWRCLDLCAYPEAVLNAPEEYNFCFDGWRPWIHGIREEAERQGMHFNQSHNIVCNFLSPKTTDAEKWDAPKHILEATAMLGGRTSLIHPIAFHDGRPYCWPEIRDANREYFLRLADTAAEYGVLLCIENMLSNRYFDGSTFKRCCTTMEELIELVDRIDHEYVKIGLDVGHAHYMGISPEDALRQCGSRVKGLHLHDNDTFSDQHLPPFGGTICWEKVMEALHDIGYQGELTLEIQRPFRNLPPALKDAVFRYIGEVGDRLGKMYDGTAGC